MTKKCRRCPLVKESADFHINRRYKDGYETICKECRKQDTARYLEEYKDILVVKDCEKYQRNKEKIKARVRNYRRINKYTLNSSFTAGRKNAKHRGIEWNLTKEEFANFYGRPCTYCNNKLGKLSSGSGLDRIDSSKSYEINNVVPCCGFCNRIKGAQLTMRETKAAIEAILKIRNLS